MDLGLTFYLINIEYLFAPTMFRTFQWHMFKWMFLRISFFLNMSSPIFHSNLLSLSYVFLVSTEKSSSQLDGVLWLWFETDVSPGSFPTWPIPSSSAFEQSLVEDLVTLMWIELKLVALSLEVLTLVFGRRKFLSGTLPVFGVKTHKFSCYLCTLKVCWKIVPGM